jgi:hypothetical protein
MNAETFAEWLRCRGQKVYRTSSSYWYNAGPRILQAFPYHWLIQPDKEEIRSLMINKNIIALRYSSPLETRTGKISYHIVRNDCYDISLLNRKVRNGIRKGLENFEIKNITFDRLSREGWILQQDTLIRQNRQSVMDKKEWECICNSALDLPGFEVFAAVRENRLAAAAIVCRIDDVYCVPYAICHREFLCKHVNNALFYTMSCTLLERENTSGIFYTVESLDAPPNIDEFKLRMGFDPVPVRQNVVWHPGLQPFISPKLHHFTRRLLRRYKANCRIAKMEGMLRFYFEGRKPLHEQEVPGCLRNILEHEAVLNLS